MDIVEILKQQAIEIAEEGHSGWGNTMLDASLEIEKLRATFEHIHEGGGSPSDDSCEKCGLDIRNPIHTRAT